MNAHFRSTLCHERLAVTSPMFPPHSLYLSLFWLILSPHSYHILIPITQSLHCSLPSSYFAVCSHTYASLPPFLIRIQASVSPFHVPRPFFPCFSERPRLPCPAIFFSVIRLFHCFSGGVHLYKRARFLNSRIEKWNRKEDSRLQRWNRTHLKIFPVSNFMRGSHVVSSKLCRA